MPGATRSRRSLAVSAALLLSLLGVAAHAQIRLDLPSQPLSQSLTAVGTLEHINVMFDPSLVEGMRAPAINAELSADDALARLLVGTKLHAVRVDANTFRVIAERDPKKSKTTGSPSPGDRKDSAPDTGETSVGNDEGSTPTSATVTSDDKKSMEGERHPQGGIEEVVVTGSNIHGIENRTTPVQVFDRDAIDRSGYATTDDFIRSIPQNFKGGDLGASPDALVSGGSVLNIESASAANLRGLGNTSTLTLVNGHRVAAAAYGSVVDLSMIPLDAVDRIEVQTDASSAIYGSDAVGGVVNILLKRDYDGAETNLRLDTLSRGGGQQKTAGQTIGRSWDRGGALLTVQYQDQQRIDTKDRDFTANTPQPTDLYPKSKKYDGVFSGHIDITPALEVSADALADHETKERAWTPAGRNPLETQVIVPTVDFVSANTTVQWKIGSSWRMEASALFSQTSTGAITNFNPNFEGYPNGRLGVRTLDTIKEGNIKLDGTLLPTGAGDIKVAVGGSYRREDFSKLTDDSSPRDAVYRRDNSAFAEIYTPLIGEGYKVPLIRKLELSAAVRYDSYTTIGDSTNPKIGLFWSPEKQVGFRGSYSRSFRVPDPYEQLVATTTNYLFIYPPVLPLPGGGVGKAIIWPNTSLKPETATNYTAGMDIQPNAIPALKLSINYYNITFKNRIISAPFSLSVLTQPNVYGPLIGQFSDDASVASFVSGFVNRGFTLLDFSGGDGSTSGIRYSYPYGQINAAKVHTEGFDVGASYVVELRSSNLLLNFNGTKIREISTGLCDSCAKTDLSNVIGQPLRLRLRGGIGWSARRLNVNTAINYAGGYADTNSFPQGNVSSYTTVDLNARYMPAALPGLKIGISISNLFNRNPPLTAPSATGARYDPANADPLGRAVSFLLTKDW